MVDAKNPYRKVDAEIDRVNKSRLKLTPVSLCRVAGSLYAQGTFPPKPGERESKQRRISLKLKANVDFLHEAQQRALAIGADLMLGKWVWQQKPVDQLPVTVAEFVDLHRQGYLDRNSHSSIDQRDTLSYWRKDFLYAYNKLPQDKPPSLAVCQRIIEQTSTNTRTRNRYVKAYRQLLELAGIDSSLLKALRGKYTATEVQPRDIPSLEQIIDWKTRINPDWQFYYFLLACFGLRGTEAHPLNCKLEDLGKGELMVYSGKTKRWRYVPCCSDRLFDALRCEPNWKNLARTPSQLSEDFTKVLARSGCPFTPYGLRHHYAYFTLLLGWDTAWSAKCMGHNIDLHQSVYWLCINQEMGRQIRRKQSIASAQSSIDQTQDS